MAITKQTPVASTQKEIRKEPKYSTKESHQITWEVKMGRRSEQRGGTISQKIIDKMALSANPITVNVNKQNPPVKIHRAAEWVRVRPATGCPPETRFRSSETHTLKVKVWEKISRRNGSKTKARVALFITERKAKPSVRKDKQEQHTMMEAKPA